VTKEEFIAETKRQVDQFMKDMMRRLAELDAQGYQHLTDEQLKQAWQEYYDTKPGMRPEGQ
jgi:hypothetical protein